MASLDETEFDPSNVTGLADRLEERGLIERRPDPADRRIKAIAMTEEGSRLRSDFQRRLAGDPGALATLNDSQIKDLHNLLKTALAQD
jgi:DNA-binding MarR family transcriptional regulator